MKHIPVLLNAVLGALGDITGKRIVDCTFGAGGYTRAFLNAGATVIAFDRDPNVVADANAIAAEFPDRFTFINRPFSEIAMLSEPVDAVVMDLGISSMQIDTGDRGFSFRFDGPLDMRMSGAGMTAADLIATTDVSALGRILRDYGDVRQSAAIARAIHAAAPKTTFALRDLIHNPHDVAPVFQALRIAVNDEMGQVTAALDAVPGLLTAGGKCVAVTFHSLEDRLVKNTFRDWTTAPGDPRMPTTMAAPFIAIRPVTPDADELARNPRARSAHMRGVIKSY